MPIVIFQPHGRSIEIRAGETILAAAIKAGVPVANSCSGEGVCGGCRMRILSGAEHLDPPSAREKEIMQKYQYNADERAACVVMPHGDITVTTSYW